MLLHRRLLIASICGVFAIAGAPSQSAGQLTHRWDFNSDATDSVGSSDWSVNGATFSGGQVVFDGVDDYLELTTTPLPTATGSSTTIEVWGTYDPSTPQNSRIWDFSSANGDFYMYLTPNRSPLPAPLDGPTTSVGWDDDFDIEFGPSSTERTPGASNTGQQVLLTLVVDSDVDTPSGAGTGQFRLYRDGSLIASLDNDPALMGILLSSLSGTDANRLGHGVSVPESPADFISAPAFLNGSINEMRVYNGVLSESEQFISAVTGPDALPPSFTDRTWNAGTGDWGTDGNWTAAGVPGVTDRAVIDNGGAANVTSAVQQAGLVSISSGSLNVGAGGDLDARYPISLAGASTIAVSGGGSLTVSRIAGDADTAVLTDTLTVDGGVVRSGFSNSEVATNVGVIIGENGATFASQAGQRLNIQGAISGSSSIAIEGEGRVALSAGLLNTYTGTIEVNNSTLDLAGLPGDFQSTSMASLLTLNNGTIEVDPGGGGGEIFLTPIHVADGTVNQIIHRGYGDASERPPNFQGGLTGDGTLIFTAPDRNNVAIGLDFGGAIDHTGFTGRYVIAAQPDTMNIAVRIRSADADFANAIFEIADEGSWIGKRGSDDLGVVDPDTGAISGVPTIELGGLSGVAGTRVEAAIAGAEDPPVGDPDVRDVTYQLGGANEDADFAGRIHDTNPDELRPLQTRAIVVSLVKAGENTQILSGNNDYSGATVVNGGALLVNGVHARLDDEPQTVDDPATVDVIENQSPDPTSPISDYLVNAGGTLGGTGVIGRATDTIDVDVLGGAIAPGDGVGTLTVVGDVSLGDGSTFAVEAQGSMVDKLIAEGLSIGPNVSLDVTTLGAVTSGSYVIAEYDTLSGVFASVTSGFTVDYSTPGQILLNVMGSIGLAGDYNDDGVVDATDYAVWREALGTSAVLPNDSIGGVIGTAHFEQWQDNFGATTPGAVATPEPSAVLVTLIGLVCLASKRKRR